MSSEDFNDAEILQALQRGEADALNRVLQRWQRPLHSFAYRYCQNQADAEDLVAQVFVRLYQQSSRLRADTRLGAWLFTALTNLCHNHHRWRTRHPTVPIESNTESRPTSPGFAVAEPTAIERAPIEELERIEIVKEVRSAIETLPHDLKTALLLHHYEHLSYREIAAIAGCSERGIETRLYRAKQLLRSKLRQHGTASSVAPS